jgi:hypothetical protein
VDVALDRDGNFLAGESLFERRHSGGFTRGLSSAPIFMVWRHYKDQLVAGYSKTTVTGGLLVYMPDYGKISKPLSPHGAETKRAATTYGLR